MTDLQSDGRKPDESWRRSRGRPRREDTDVTLQTVWMSEIEVTMRRNGQRPRDDDDDDDDTNRWT